MSAAGAATTSRLQQLPGPGEPGAPQASPRLFRARVQAHDEVAEDHWLLTLEAPEMARVSQPGQFAMLTLARDGEDGPVLPRPMALYAWDARAGTVQVLYRIVGAGTAVLATWRPGEIMTAVGPVGRGFHLLPDTRSCLLLGRGIGVCSLTSLAPYAAERSVDLHVVSSARKRAYVVGGEVYRAAGARSLLEVADEDGTSAVEALRPYVRALADEHGIGQVFVCGSERLVRLGAELGAPVQVSIEAHMACGLGYCHGCSTGSPTLTEEAPLVCAGGPVFAYVAEGGA